MNKKEENSKKQTPKRVRLMISVPEDIDGRLEVLANRMQLKKTQVCSMMIAQTLFSWEQTWGIFSDPAALGQLLGSIQIDDSSKKYLSQCFNKGVEAGEQLVDEVLKNK